MNQLFIFIIGLVLGGAVVWFFVKSKTTTGKLQKFNVEREKEREANKQKIIDFLGEKGKATNNDIQTLISVSDATATRYLDELEKEGKVKQVGDAGHYVYYEKATTA